MSARALSALFNGRPADGHLAFHRGFHYGDGVFRTCFIFEQKVFDLEEQIQTIIKDASQLGLKITAIQHLKKEARKLAADHRKAALKIVLIRQGQQRGYRNPSGKTDRLLCCYPAQRYPSSHWQHGIRVFRSSFRLASQPALAGIKHLNRLEQVLASRQWEPGSEEGILSDEKGRPVSGTRSNLFWVRNGVLYSPDLSRCGVAGLMRKQVLQTATALQQHWQVLSGSWEELEKAQEVFVTNSLIGLWPVRALGNRSWKAPGPVTRRLMENIRHPRIQENLCG